MCEKSPMDEVGSERDPQKVAEKESSKYVARGRMGAELQLSPNICWPGVGYYKVKVASQIMSC